MCTEEEENPGADGSVPALNVGGEGATSSQPSADPSPADPEDVDTIIEEVARDAAAEADKIAAEEAAKTAAEEAAKGSTKETGKAAGQEAGKGPAGEAGKAAAKEGAVGDQASSSTASDSCMYLKGIFPSHVAETQAWFREAHKELKAAQDVLDERKLELVMKQADIEKAQELAREQAAKDEAARHQHPAELNSQEEDLVKELEVERDGLKDQALKLEKEKDTLNGALLEGLEETLSGVRAREETLTKDLEKERQLRKNEAANHADFVKGKNLSISCLADVAGRIITKLAAMGMPNLRALEQFHSNRAGSLADEARKLCPGVMTKVLTKQIPPSPPNEDEPMQQAEPAVYIIPTSAALETDVVDIFLNKTGKENAFPGQQATKDKTDEEIEFEEAVSLPPKEMQVELSRSNKEENDKLKEEEKKYEEPMAHEEVVPPVVPQETEKEAVVTQASAEDISKGKAPVDVAGTTSASDTAPKVKKAKENSCAPQRSASTDLLFVEPDDEFEDTAGTLIYKPDAPRTVCSEAHAATPASDSTIPYSANSDLSSSANSDS
nr:uncharacterized protein LOC123494495 [Aegilops tauschii subsp. strangulata]